MPAPVKLPEIIKYFLTEDYTPDPDTEDCHAPAGSPLELVGNPTSNAEFRCWVMSANETSPLIQWEVLIPAHLIRKEVYRLVSIKYMG